jgi:hypothetical protein
MTLIKSLLLGSAAGIVAVATAQAADLPTRKAAPVEYVRVCNVGGITGWTLPGSDTCVKFSGYMTAHFIGGNLSTQYNNASAVDPAVGTAIAGANGTHFAQTLMVQGSDVAPTVFNGSAAPVTIAGVTYAPGATILSVPTTAAAATMTAGGFPVITPAAALALTKPQWLRYLCQHRLCDLGGHHRW